MADSFARQIKNDHRIIRIFTEFIRFVQDEHLEEFVHLQPRYFKEFNLPLLQSMNARQEAELQVYARKISIEFLQYLSLGRIEEYIVQSLERWKKDQIGLPDINPLSLEDILSITAIRKKSLSVFLLRFTRNIDQIQLINETLDQVFHTFNLAVHGIKADSVILVTNTGVFQRFI